MSLIAELERRNVFRVGLAYAAASWLLIQLAEIVFEAWAVPPWGLRVLITVLAVGLPLVLVFAWVFELTPEGLRRESEIDPEASMVRQTARRLDRVIIVVLALAVGYFALDKFVLRAPPEAGANGSGAGEESLDAAPAAGSGLPDERSLAVLPLENLGQAIEDEVFAAGIHNDLLTELASISSLRVVARSSVARFADSELPPREIAELLDVAAILEGGVQRAGDQLRVSLQLVDAASESYLWAETFDRRLTADNLFAVRSEIARAVTGALEATLTRREEDRLQRLPTADLQALEHYYEGIALMDRRNARDLQAARAAFRRARERDPDFARALAGEAQAILLLRQGSRSYGTIPRVEAIALARPLLERAGTLAPDDSQVLAVQGLLASDDDRPAEAVALLRRSLAGNPSNAEAINWLGIALAAVGEFEALPELARQALAVDPASRLALANGILTLAGSGQAQPGEIAPLLARLERLDPAWGSYVRAELAQIEGRVVDAVRARYETLAIDRDFTMARDDLAVMLLWLGLGPEARKVVATLPESELALETGDWERALALSQAEFEANPQDPDAVIRLARSLGGAGQTEAALRLALLAWEGSGRNPFAWPSEALVDVAWAARRIERQELHAEFLTAARKAIASQSQESLSWDLLLARAKLAVLEGRPAAAASEVRQLVDGGYRRRLSFEQPIWEPLRDDLAFRRELERLDALIADERREVREMLCGADPVLGWREPAAGTCQAR